MSTYIDLKPEDRERNKSQRMLYPLSDCPQLDIPTRYREFVVVFTGYGRQFKIGCDHPSMFGHHLLGHEGEYGCYCYYRLATEEEITALEAKDSADE
jgi:hypothetical protein